MIVKMAGERAVKEAIAAYKSHMQHTVESLPVDEVTLSTAHATGTFRMSTYFLPDSQHMNTQLQRLKRKLRRMKKPK